MTGLLSRPDQLWNTMPGWGIAADLTPPELVDARRMKRLRQVIVLCLLAVVLVCIAGYAYAYVKHSAAKRDLDQATSQTGALRAQEDRYAGVTQIKATTADFRAKVAALSAKDVDLAALVSKVRKVLPNSMAMSQISITMNTAGSAGGASASLDTSGRLVIGTVTVSGYARSLNDLPGYVDRLETITGVTDVLPASNQRSETSATYSVSLNVTDRLYLHRRAAAQTGGN